MKTKIVHTLKDTNNNVLIENEDLEYVKRAQEDYKNRRTGRSTRTLFRALSYEYKDIVIVSPTIERARYLSNQFIRILRSLDFDYYGKYDSSDIGYNSYIVFNMDRRFRFISKDEATLALLTNDTIMVYDHE